MSEEPIVAEGSKPNLTRVVAILLSFTIAACASTQVQSAQEIYQARCQGCHAPDGHGTVVGRKLGAKDFRDPEILKLPASTLAKIVSDGRNKMPSYKETLTAAEIRQLVRYIRQMK